MIRCRTCHYDLRGQTALRCPECGAPFDPDNPLTYEGDQAGAFARIEELKRDVIVGLAELDRGEGVEYDDKSLEALGEDVKARGRKRLAAKKKG